MPQPSGRPPSAPALAEAVAVAVLVTAGGLLAVSAWVAPPVARNLLPEATWSPLPTVRALVLPEPVETVRYLVALTAPFVLGLVTIVTWRRLEGQGRPVRVAGATALVVAQVLALGLLAASWREQAAQHRWFSNRALVAAVALAALVLLLAWRGWLTSVLTPTGGRRRARVVAGVLVAAVVTGVWLLPAVFQETNIARADEVVRYHVQFTMNEFLAVANGRSPLVEFAAQYTRLLPYAVAPVLAVFGSSVGVFTIVMWVMGLAAFLAVYLLFTEITEDGLSGLALYLPFLAVSMSTVLSAADERVYLANLYGFVPLRLFGPFLLAWPLVRQLRRPGRRAPYVLFAAAGLIAINNPEMGLPCAAATFAALACATGDDPRRGLRRLGAQAAVGGAVAVLLTCGLALAQTGRLPSLPYLGHFSRVFGVEGFGMLPMPALGLHVVIYLTFAACIAVALVTVATRQPLAPRDTVLCGALAFAGVLGLGGSAYWVGRSDPLALAGVFPTWGLAGALLGWWVLRTVAGRPAAGAWDAVRVAVPAMLALTVVALMALSARQFPSPWSQVQRIRTGEAPTAGGAASSLWCVLRPADDGAGGPCPLAPVSLDRSAAARFVSARTRPGERVAVLASLGHGIARQSRVVNVSPYSHPDSIVFYEMVDFLVDALDRSGARTLFLGTSYPEIPAELRRRGFAPGAHDAESGLTEWARAG